MLAHTSKPAQSGRRTLNDAEQIIRAWQNSLPKKQVYTYDRYITDSTDLIEKISNLCSHNGSGIRFLFEAMPGGGKTFFACKELVEKINAKTEYRKTVVLAVPNNIQCWQNRRAYGTYAVAGDSDENIDLEAGISKKVYTAVYECAAVLAAKPATELKNVVLVVDEAHQLMTECDYRAFDGILAAADAVYAAGGVVMCMTATPSSILQLWPYSAWIVAEHKDGKKTNAKAIDFVSVDTKKIKVFDVVLDEIRKLQKTHRMAVVRYQSKDKIEQARKILEAEGITCEILTADCKKKVRESDGNIYYKSQVYAGLIENGTLPDVNCLLCTSILEVGTSVVGVNRGGQIVKEPGLTPIFACQRADTDLDRMLQFFARFRFQINVAKIVCAKCQTPIEEPVDLTQGADTIILKKATTLYMQRDHLATAFSKDKFRRLLKSWHGHMDGKGLTEEGKIDLPLLWADAVQRYFDLVYRQEGAVQPIIRAEFGVPVTITTISSIDKKSKPKKGISISEKAKEDFRALMADDKVFTVLAGDERDIQKNSKIQAFAETYPESAKSLLKAIGPYADCEVFMPQHVRRDLATEAAIAAAEDPRTPYVPASKMQALYHNLAYVYPAQVVKQVLDAAAGLIDKPVLPGYLQEEVKPWEFLWYTRSLARAIGGQKYSDYLELWKQLRKYGNFDETAKLFANPEADTARYAAEAKTVITPTCAMDMLYHELFTYPAQVAEQILDAAAGLIDKPVLPGYLQEEVKPWEILWSNRSLARTLGGQKYDDYLIMWKIFRTLDSKARFEKFRKITQIIANYDAEFARRARYAYTCVHLNRAERKGLYTEVACPDASYVAAEHQVLTHPERYLYRAKRKDGKLDSRCTDTFRWYEDKKTDLSYPERLKKGAFVGKELTSDQLKVIAEGFGASITRMAGKTGIHGERYSAEDIFWMIQSAYTIAFVKGRDAAVKQPQSLEEFEEMGKAGIKMKIRGFRMNAPSWMTAIMPDTTAGELEKERIKNILVRREKERQSQITLHPIQPMPKQEPEVEVIARQEIPTESKIEPKNNGNNGKISQDVLKKIGRYEQLLAQINYNVQHSGDDENWTITDETPEIIVETAYKTARGILLDAKIFDAKTHETVTRWTYNGGYSRQAFLDILTK